MENFTGEKSLIELVDPYDIAPCPYQTRENYSTQGLQQLICSIKENGILQPLTATKTAQGYQLIAGHRRLIAAKILKLETVPVVVLKKSETEIAVLCAIENLHREDLNFFEQVRAIQLLIEQLGLTQSQAGVKLSLTQPAIANKLKLLQFSKETQKLMLKAGLTERHARAVSRLETSKQQRAIEHIIKHSLNVASTDQYIDGLLDSKPKAKRKTIINIKDVRLFTNTLTKAVRLMKTAGFEPLFQQSSTQDAIEYRIVIPYSKKKETISNVCAATNIR
ncbi:MAG: ParB/RepB/Spo0J family partition protein [Oscillospiraceae bacterium]